MQTDSISVIIVHEIHRYFVPANFQAGIWQVYPRDIVIRPKPNFTPIDIQLANSFTIVFQENWHTTPRNLDLKIKIDLDLTKILLTFRQCNINIITNISY